MKAADSLLSSPSFSALSHAWFSTEARSLHENLKSYLRARAAELTCRVDPFNRLFISLGTLVVIK